MATATAIEDLGKPANARAQHRVLHGVLGSVISLIVPLTLLATPRSDVVAVVGFAGSDTADADLARMIAKADGTILNVGGRPNIVIARSSADGFVGRLYRAGARLVLDGQRARGCGRGRSVTHLQPRPDRDTGRFPQ
jgi:hypothetical protein